MKRSRRANPSLGVVSESFERKVQAMFGRVCKALETEEKPEYRALLYQALRPRIDAMLEGTISDLRKKIREKAKKADGDQRGR